MNLLSHRNVTVVARFARDTFSFLPPDHWTSSRKAGTASWQVLVIEVSNQLGRDLYRNQPGSHMREAARAIGATLVDTRCIDTAKSARRARPPSDSFLRARVFHPQSTAPHPDESPTPCFPLLEPSHRFFPPGRRVFTDGSLMEEGGVGAAYYAEDTDSTTLVPVGGEATILRAELTAILKVLQDKADQPDTLQVFTDSLLSLRLIRRWVHAHRELDEKAGYMDLLDSIGAALCLRQGDTELHKVRAHVGIEGNERADQGAKRVATGDTADDTLDPADVTPTASPQEHTLFVGGEPLTDTKKQLKLPVTHWLTVTRGYKCTVGDMWEGPEASQLDKVASNSVLWGTGGYKHLHQVKHVLRARFLETVTQARLHATNPTAHPSDSCELCRKPANWFHIASMCTHPDMADFYTVRHNEAGKALASAIRGGKHGRWLTLTSFGRVDDLPETATVPTWMLSSGGRTRANLGVASDGGAGTTHGGSRPDVMILEGWPEGAEPPARPTKKWEPATGRPGRGVKIILGELGFSSDLSTGKTIARKQQKYAALIRELEAEGWRVDDHIRVITVGVRATVPLSNERRRRAQSIGHSGQTREADVTAHIRQDSRITPRQDHQAVSQTMQTALTAQRERWTSR